jgi:hypothetical protein
MGWSEHGVSGLSQDLSRTLTGMRCGLSLSRPTGHDWWSEGGYCKMSEAERE